MLLLPCPDGGTAEGMPDWSGILVGSTVTTGALVTMDHKAGKNDITLIDAPNRN